MAMHKEHLTAVTTVQQSVNTMSPKLKKIIKNILKTYKTKHKLYCATEILVKTCFWKHF